LTANLARNRKRWEHLTDAAPVSNQESRGSGRDRLTELTGFGSNPGNLRAFFYVPEALESSPALVVVLHGCGQTAAGYDFGAGWSTLADRYGFALLLPEQKRANNPKTCFSWFSPGDTTRGRGEALSIRQMVDRMVRDHGIDRGRIFATGLSAGGAMTSAMLAAYPDVFAGGAIIAGLPYGAARTVNEALESMFKGRSRTAGDWGDLVRAASPHRGPWPRVSVWHGSADTTVAPINAQEIVKQWTDVHGVASSQAEWDEVDGYPRRVWRGAAGESVVEEYTITGMAHGTPLAPSASDDPHGAAGPFLLDAGIASSYHIAAFWGLTTASRRRYGRAGAGPGGRRTDSSASSGLLDAQAPRGTEAPLPGASRRVGRLLALIAKALKRVGLLKR
jgi:feruloyl esterase